jgi:DNA polymerase V
MRPHLIGHLDADCFYVSAERVRFPFLRDKPAGIQAAQWVVAAQVLLI